MPPPFAASATRSVRSFPSSFHMMNRLLRGLENQWLHWHRVPDDQKTTNNIRGEQHRSATIFNEHLCDILTLHSHSICNPLKNTNSRTEILRKLFFGRHRWGKKSQKIRLFFGLLFGRLENFAITLIGIMHCRKGLDEPPKGELSSNCIGNQQWSQHATTEVVQYSPNHMHPAMLIQP